jgi:hypothetical protein
MADQGNEAARTSADALLKHYSFDQGDLTSDQILDRWLRSYPARWVRLALVEALYQGRYKAISVEQILARWVRRGQPMHHFNDDFERLVCNNLPKSLLESPESELQDSGQENERSRFSVQPSISSELPPWQAPLANPAITSASTLGRPVIASEALSREFPTPETSDFFAKLTTIARAWKGSGVEQVVPRDRL